MHISKYNKPNRNWYFALLLMIKVSQFEWSKHLFLRYLFLLLFFFFQQFKNINTLIYCGRWVYIISPGKISRFFFFFFHGSIVIHPLSHKSCYTPTDNCLISMLSRFLQLVYTLQFFGSHTVNKFQFEGSNIGVGGDEYYSIQKSRLKLSRHQ